MGIAFNAAAVIFQRYELKEVFYYYNRVYIIKKKVTGKVSSVFGFFTSLFSTTKSSDNSAVDLTVSPCVCWRGKR